MNPVASWLLAFLLTSVTALTLLMGERRATREPAPPRDAATLAEVDAELILNRIREGDLVAIKGDLNGAKTLWKAAREKGVGYWPIHEALAESMARNGLDLEADAEFETAIHIAANQLGRAPAPLCLKRAGLLLRMKQPEPALKLLIECGSPDSLAGPMSRILKESPALIEIVKQAAETRDPRLWALVAGHESDPAKKASALGRFVRSVAPGNRDLAMRAAHALREAKRLDEAIEVAVAWSKAAPSNVEAYELWGRLLAESGDRDRARLVLSTMVDIRPGDASAHLRLGSALRDLDDFAGAIAQFEEARRLRPEDAIALDEIALAQVAQGNFEAAAGILGKMNARASGALRLRVAEAAQRRIEVARKSGDRAAVSALRRWCGELGIPEAGLFDIKIIMKWDAVSDVDLDVTEPGGETVNHHLPKSKHGALYPFDNTQGRGPEHYTLSKAPTGKYRVGVHLHGSTPSVAEIEVILFEDTPRERRLTARVELNGKLTASWPLEFEIP
ncbi:MAG TPA: tetratricopeptide repeat protein [Planctomycetota bacterium]|nr:tetratricopeptide repeat protein [Planctomycetota bacterium]